MIWLAVHFYIIFWQKEKGRKTSRAEKVKKKKKPEEFWKGMSQIWGDSALPLLSMYLRYFWIRFIFDINNVKCI